MTTMLHNFHFIRPAWLLLAPLAIGLWWLWQRRSDPLRGWREQIAPELLVALVVGRESGKSGSPRWLLVAWLVAYEGHRHHDNQQQRQDDDLQPEVELAQGAASRAKRKPRF